MSKHTSGTPDICKTTVFHADIEKVWEAAATPKGIEAWFMPNNFTPQAGEEFTLHTPFGPTPCKVLEFDAPYKLVFAWGEDGWIVSFELKDLGDKTEFTLVHSGWGEPEDIVPGPGPDQTNEEIRNRMNNGWDSLVHEKLRKVVEE
ncbi:SRPBCC family protein [Alteribacillus bidgolensis]|uniref:Uncharacterized conserved protein YndB, AHSA1/START domain n=1 Tax=Alteribacillus bidgolensis TaxID=930129 RepID=A0A1G8CR31_9BACI|nr:SRPBCC domain-containing protein [Alteribacillus bidgolensis]SDH47380.1 Uncharacterized conserved protein YndB, AHSA1/START domain [Alteribacillus bidgolensis]